MPSPRGLRAAERLPLRLPTTGTGHYLGLGLTSLMPKSTLIAERAIKPFVIGRKNWLFSDTPRGAEASAAVYSIVVTAKLNGLNQRAYLEWLLTEMPNDPHLREPGWIDRYLPWSEDVPASCRLTTARVDEGAALPDEPIVDAAALEAVEGTLETR